MHIRPWEWDDASVVAKQIATACHCDRLRRAARAVTTIYDDWLAPTGIRLPELVVLSTIFSAEDETIGMDVLADRLEAHRTTVSRTVATTARHGFTWREGNRVTISPRGKDIVTEAVPRWNYAEENIVSRITREEERKTNEVLERLIRLSDERFDPIPESG